MKLVNLRADSEQHERWKQAAEKAGMTFSEWARGALDAKARQARYVRDPRRATPPEPAPEPERQTVAAKRTYQPDFKKAKRARA